MSVCPALLALAVMNAVASVMVAAALWLSYGMNALAGAALLAANVGMIVFAWCRA